MIWSLIKIIFFITIIALVTLVTGVIIDAGGVITMQFASYEISLTPIQGIIGIILCMSSLLATKWLSGYLSQYLNFLMVMKPL